MPYAPGVFFYFQMRALLLLFVFTLAHFHAGRRTQSTEREKTSCLVVRAEEGAPSTTIAGHMLQLKLDEVSEPARFLAQKSRSATKVRILTSF